MAAGAERSGFGCKTVGSDLWAGTEVSRITGVPPVPDRRYSGNTHGRDARDTNMQKSLDQKLANIHADPSGAKDFILADAKDADMAAGLAAPGKHGGSGRTRSLSEYRDQMREVTRQGLVDIMLMSASTSDLLTIQERLFDNSHVTPAVRANDTTDIHLPAGGTYAAEPSRPFRTATIEQIQSGKVNPTEGERR